VVNDIRRELELKGEVRILVCPKCECRVYSKGKADGKEVFACNHCGVIEPKEI
jgi:tRNA(Ile2) C34 agmatinyltransferase TiaS